MSRVEPLDPPVCVAIAPRPDVALPGAVTTFCAERGIARKTFYSIRNGARLEGQVAAVEPRIRRPSTIRNRISDEVKLQTSVVTPTNTS